MGLWLWYENDGRNPRFALSPNQSPSALQGQTIKDFLVEAVRAKLTSDKAKPNSKRKQKTGWEAAFGAADPKDVAEVQRIIDEEFSKIDPDDWK